MILFLYFSFVGQREVRSFFLLDLVLTPKDLCVFHSLKFGSWDNWYMCNSMWICLQCFSLSSFPSLCNSSDFVSLSLFKAQPRALFCNVCSFFLIFLVAEGKKKSPYSKIGRIIFL